MSQRKRKKRKKLRIPAEPLKVKLKPAQLDTLYTISQLKYGLMNPKDKRVKEALISRGFAKITTFNFCRAEDTPFLKITKLGKQYIDNWKAQRLAEIAAEKAKLQPTEEPKADAQSGTGTEPARSDVATEGEGNEREIP